MLGFAVSHAQHVKACKYMLCKLVHCMVRAKSHETRLESRYECNMTRRHQRSAVKTLPVFGNTAQPCNCNFHWLPSSNHASVILHKVASSLRAAASGCSYQLQVAQCIVKSRGVQAKHDATETFFPGVSWQPQCRTNSH